MIEANQLRIGNWYDDNGEYKQITANDILEAWEAPRTWMNPIHLTPEILKKCGLKDIWIKNSWKIVEDISGGESFGWAMKVRNASYTKEIEFAYFKYLHQLQNLYYCLCGEELIYKP